MSSISKLSRNFTVKSIAKYQTLKNIREMSDHGPRLFPMALSRWQWHKFKDFFHYYILIGLIPVLGAVTYANIFVGPATLMEIPDDYTPKHWEYQRHPITRFLAQYVFNSPQQEYEKCLHVLYEESERQSLRQLETDVKAKMAERNDYKSYYYKPTTAKYHHECRAVADHINKLRGD